LVLPAFRTLSLPRRALFGSLTAAAAITLANLAIVSTVWFSYRADYSAMIASFGKPPNGSILTFVASPECMRATSYDFANPRLRVPIKFYFFFLCDCKIFLPS
jgi:hypothetical protein